MKTTKVLLTNLDGERVGDVQVDKPENDYLGEIYYSKLRLACRLKGFRLKFYTSTKEDFDFNAIVETI